MICEFSFVFILFEFYDVVETIWNGLNLECHRAPAIWLSYLLRVGHVIWSTMQYSRASVAVWYMVWIQSIYCQWILH